MNALLFATTVKVVDFSGVGVFLKKMVEASVANERDGVMFGKVVDCVARAIMEDLAICCYLDCGSKRKGSGWEREWIREER